METAEDPPLDEIRWSSPSIAQNMGGVHTNTILPYFAESVFFDKTSNNATLATQALYNPNMYHLLQTREAFEGRLRSMAGLEYLVVGDPSNNGTKIENSGVWVIRKQNRRKRQGLEDDITPINSYFVIGENVYMAPSVANVLQSRILSTVSSLTKAFDNASPLPSFSPALGHTYLPPTSKPFSATSSLQPTQTSKENTPMPETQNSLQSSRAQLTSDKTSTANFRTATTLAQSFALSTRFTSEYLDENPLVGEPGSFILQKSREAGVAQSQPINKATSSAKPSAPPTPAPLKTDIPPVEMKKGLKGGDKTPITPGTKEKKRKKSRVATTTPK